MSKATTAEPTRAVQIANAVLFQIAWFAIVLGAAYGLAFWGVACAVVVIGWHLAISARTGMETALLVCALAIGFVFETLMVSLGHVRYASDGHPIAWLAPYWLVALWGLFATTLNVSLRWLRGRWLLATIFGAIGGPLSFAAGVRLGAASFVHRESALLVLAIAWGALMPTLMFIARRLDGVTVLDDDSTHRQRVGELHA